MPYKIYEYLPTKALYLMIWGHFTDDELLESNQKAIEYLDQNSTKVSLISDFTYMTNYTKNVFKLANAFTVFNHPQHHWQVVISDDKLVSFISNTVIQIGKRTNNKYNFKIVPNSDDAMEFIRNIFPEYTELPPFPDFDNQ